MSRACRALALVLLTAFLLITPITAKKEESVPTLSPVCTAKGMALIDADSGTLLAAQNEDLPLPMASTTKIMTALVAIEHLPLDLVVSVPKEAVGIEGSSVYLYEGERITVETLLYALLLSSANDAAVVLALEAAESIEGFAALMNEKAAALGLSNTHFCNPHGLHDAQHYTTARELALLTAHALKNDTFARIVATKRHTAPQNGTEATRLFLNHNRLLRSYDGAIGVKTGFTKNAGRCFVSAARKGTTTLVCVTLSCPDDWRTHAVLLDYGFANYTTFSPTVPPFSVPVVGGSIGEVALLPSESLSLLLPANHGKIECSLEMPRFLYGGFAQGECVGKLVYRLDGVKIGEITLLTATSCEAQAPLGFWGRLKRIFQK